MKPAIVSIVCAFIFCYAFTNYKSEQAYIEGYKIGFIKGVNAAPKQNIDNTCSKWMFNTNLKEAKKRICSKGQS